MAFDLDMSTAVVVQDPLRPTTRLKRLRVGETFTAPLSEERRWRAAACFVGRGGKIQVTVTKGPEGVCCTRTT